MARFVYRAIRMDESNYKYNSIEAKRPNANVAIHNAVGRNTPSQYIHCTASPFVALYYAEACQRERDESYHRVVVIDLESQWLNGWGIDLSTDAACAEAGIHPNTKAWNFAIAHQVVLIQGDVHPECILGCFDTEDLEVARGRCSFQEFVKDLPIEASKFVANWVSNLEPPVVKNTSDHCLFQTGYIFAEGTHKHVYEGVYDRGQRAGFPCVVKMAKDRRVMNDLFWQEDLKAVEKAQKIIAAFNQNWREDCHVYLTWPSVWTVLGGKWKNQKNLTEPMIMGDYCKFNSNSGYADSDDFMQALSHSSYHYTKGDVLICDLQGAQYDERYILTDPVLMSRNRKYGATDLGQEGIDNFFYYHECGQYCKKHWWTARNPRPLFHAREGTSLLYDNGQVVGTSRLGSIYEDYSDSSSS